MATTEGGAAGALVRGIRPDDFRARKLIAGHIVAARSPISAMTGSRSATAWRAGSGSGSAAGSP